MAIHACLNAAAVINHDRSESFNYTLNEQEMTFSYSGEITGQDLPYRYREPGAEFVYKLRIEKCQFGIKN
jgi:hypothetical protein